MIKHLYLETMDEYFKAVAGVLPDCPKLGPHYFECVREGKIDMRATGSNESGVDGIFFSPNTLDFIVGLASKLDIRLTGRGQLTVLT